MGGLGKWPGQEFQAALNWHTVKLIKEKYNIPLVLSVLIRAMTYRRSRNADSWNHPG